MKTHTITIHWHNDTAPIYSVTFQPHTGRLVTAGGDNNVRVWEFANGSVRYLSTLRKHTQAVNVVRFSPDGQILLTAGDDGTIMLWELSPTLIRDIEDDDEPEESWVCVAQIRSNSEVNDVSWAPDGSHIIAGSMDNVARVYRVHRVGPQKFASSLVETLAEHSHYVQGVAWDPLGEYLATQSADRTLNVHSAKSKALVHRFARHDGHLLYHSETLQSFFRRLAFSPDGALLVSPAGIEDEDTDAIYVYTRQSLQSSPVFKLKGIARSATVVVFSHKRYVTKSNVYFQAPYAMIFAVATLEAVMVYRTDTFEPVAYVDNLHYSSVTDLAWSDDGKSLVVSSTDGFCSVVEFDDLGEEYKREDVSDHVSEANVEAKVPV